MDPLLHVLSAKYALDATDISGRQIQNVFTLGSAICDW